MFFLVKINFLMFWVLILLMDRQYISHAVTDPVFNLTKLDQPGKFLMQLGISKAYLNSYSILFLSFFDLTLSGSVIMRLSDQQKLLRKVKNYSLYFDIVM